MHNDWNIGDLIVSKHRNTKTIYVVTKITKHIVVCTKDGFYDIEMTKDKRTYAHAYDIFSVVIDSHEDK